jgi:catechol 2,3-dioxygenase-like lactoylglutathione lyase family enzyme
MPARGEDMSEWPKNVGAISLFVEELPRSKQFYEDVFGLPAVYEDENSAVFRFGSTMVNLLDIGAAPTLIAPGVVAAREAGSRFQLTIFVDDADAVCAELTDRGVAFLNGPMDRDWGMRTAAFADPAGHTWEIAQELPAGGL